jgi:hypothetical protein
LYLFSLFDSTSFHTIQPAMMEKLLAALEEAETEVIGIIIIMIVSINSNIDSEFPYVYAIVLILSPFFHSLFDVNGLRLLFHWSVKGSIFYILFFFFFVCSIIYCVVRTALAGLIYNKTLLLNIATQTNTNPGKLLSLIVFYHLFFIFIFFFFINPNLQRQLIHVIWESFFHVVHILFFFPFSFPSRWDIRSTSWVSVPLLLLLLLLVCCVNTLFYFILFLCISLNDSFYNPPVFPNHVHDCINETIPLF